MNVMRHMDIALWHCTPSGPSTETIYRSSVPAISMEEGIGNRSDVSSLLHWLVHSECQFHQHSLEQLNSEIEEWKQIQNQILGSIDEQRHRHRCRLLEFEGQLRHDSSLWLAPRRGQLESTVSRLEQVRWEQLVKGYQQLQQLRRERRQLQQAWHQAKRTEGLLTRWAWQEYGVGR